MRFSHFECIALLAVAGVPQAVPKFPLFSTTTREKKKSRRRRTTSLGKFDDDDVDVDQDSTPSSMRVTKRRLTIASAGDVSDDDEDEDDDVELFGANRQQRFADALKSSTQQPPTKSRWRSGAKPGPTPPPAKKKTPMLAKTSVTSPSFDAMLKRTKLSASKMKAAVDELTQAKQHFDLVDAEELEENEDDGAAYSPKQPSTPLKN